MSKCIPKSYNFFISPARKESTWSPKQVTSGQWGRSWINKVVLGCSFLESGQFLALSLGRPIVSGSEFLICNSWFVILFSCTPLLGWRFFLPRFSPELVTRHCLVEGFLQQGFFPSSLDCSFFLFLGFGLYSDASWILLVMNSSKGFCNGGRWTTRPASLCHNSCAHRRICVLHSTFTKARGYTSHVTCINGVFFYNHISATVLRERES
jgi:hypothetical protein